MSSSTGSGRKRTTSRQCSAEDQALNQIAKEVSIEPDIYALNHKTATLLLWECVSLKQ